MEVQVAQGRCTPIARLYAAGCLEEQDVQEEGEQGGKEEGERPGTGAEGAGDGSGRQKEAAAKADLRKVLNAKAVPDARVRRSLRPDVPIAH